MFATTATTRGLVQYETHVNALAFSAYSSGTRAFDSVHDEGGREKWEGFQLGMRT